MVGQATQRVAGWVHNVHLEVENVTKKYHLLPFQTFENGSGMLLTSKPEELLSGATAHLPFAQLPALQRLAFAGIALLRGLKAVRVAHRGALQRSARCLASVFALLCRWCLQHCAPASHARAACAAGQRKLRVFCPVPMHSTCRPHMVASGAVSGRRGRTQAAMCCRCSAVRRRSPHALALPSTACPDPPHFFLPAAPAM